MNGDLVWQTSFWVSLGVIVYVYFGYPLLLKLDLLGCRVDFIRRDVLPSISVIVPAHNEESTIAQKLESLIDSDYPRELVEILVGSDGSSDSTEKVVERFHDEGVGLISFPKQQGKSAMQNGLVSFASGDILVFTDADTLLERSALRRLAENFADSRVGLVTARALYSNASEASIVANESLYLRYDTWLRRRESERGILAMASGALFALRRGLWQPLDPTLGDDFELPLRMVRAGMRNVIDERVTALTRLGQDRPGSMVGLKVRIISKDLRALLIHRELLNPVRHGALAVGLWSHKVLRWFVPPFLLAVLASSLLLAGHPFFRAALWFELAFCALALVGTLPFVDRLPLCSVPASFCLVNLAAVLGIVKCVTGRTSGKWHTVRAPSAHPSSALPHFRDFE
ncbi:MAG TPA: glycosyltransferase [Candidatus Aquilonibacter sp.]|nr:glycosyltransferase [Candidatus Aquilonibacter sp.]